MNVKQNRTMLIAGLALLLSLIGVQRNYAQAPTISYPTAAEDLIRGYSQGNLTVKVVFNGSCTGATTVKVALPASVTYAAGTVIKTGGTAAIGIAESNISDLRNPVFSISGIAATGDYITFTIARSATCGNLATAANNMISLQGIVSGVYMLSIWTDGILHTQQVNVIQ